VALSHVSFSSHLNQKYMFDMIEQRRSTDTKEQRWDLFSALLDATEDGEAEKLTDRELLGMLLALCGDLASIIVLGNIFVLLLAGHEVSLLHLINGVNNATAVDHCSYAMLYVVHMCP
jgi:hypothetical protein